MDGNAIIKIVTDYLRRSTTDYAIMINGEWGCGKTFFVDTDLSKVIMATTCPNNSETYRPVYYSLFGVSSSDEISHGIKRQIVIHRANEKEKSKKKKEDAATITGTTLGIIADLFNVDSKRLLNLYDLKDIPENAVLIFDDLERSKMPLTELLGVINNYAVVDKKKVIVICNETKLEKDFCDFKEKTIRFTLNYSPSQEDVFKNIINTKLEISPSYKTFLEDNLPIILETFHKGKCANVRTLIFIIDIFEEIYYETKDNEFAQDFLKGFLMFTCIYSIEYKRGTPTDELSWFADFTCQYGMSSFLTLAANKESNKKENEEETFIEYISRYGENCLKDVIAARSIAEYIQFGNLNKNKFREEQIREGARYVSLNKTPHGRILSKMMDWRLIGDTELNDVLTDVEHFLRGNKYNAIEISILYARYLKLKSNNIECKDIDSTIFFEAVDRLKERWVSIAFPEDENGLFKWTKLDNPYNTQYAKLYKYILKIDKNVTHRRMSGRRMELIYKIRENNLDSLKQYVRGMEHNFLFIQDPDVFWDALSKSSYDIQQYIIELIKEAIADSALHTYEINFIKGFSQHFRDLIIGVNYDFGKFKYKELIFTLNEILRRGTKDRLLNVLDNMKHTENNAFVVMDYVDYTFSFSNEKINGDGKKSIETKKILRDLNKKNIEMDDGEVVQYFSNH